MPVADRAGLDAIEARRISEAVAWVSGRALSPEVVLDEVFLRDLHRRMFRGVWRWAGEYRRSDKNIGVPWFQVPVEIRGLLADADAWISSGAMPRDEVAVRLGHRLVWIHPFPNGNGRHSRLVSDCMAIAQGGAPFTWGGSLAEPRPAYLAAVRSADMGDVGPLLAFSRS